MRISEAAESRERQPKLLFKLTLMRHEKPYYKDEGHDLTPEGVERAIATGKRLRGEGVIGDTDNIYLIHSPQPRAKGTIDFLAEGAGLEDKLPRAVRQLRKSDMPGYQIFLDRILELDSDQELVARDHYTHSMHSERPDIIEPHGDKRKRLYRTLEYMIRWFENHSSQTSTPHVIAVSHFEIITHIVHDVFGIENVGRYNAPSFGEIVSIEIYQKEKGSDVLFKVTFDGKTREVYFDRTGREVRRIEDTLQ